MDNISTIDGFVALIDVLGFREMIGRDDDLSHVQQYIQTVVSLLDGGEGSALQFVLFSDNLVINTKDNTDTSFCKLILACSHLSFELMQKRIAVRGSIARGKFVRSPTTRQGVILAGRPIVEADHYQHRQDWVGTMLAPSVVRGAPKLPERISVDPLQAGEDRKQWLDRVSLAVHLQPWGEIPFHVASHFDKASFDGFAVVPMRAGVSSPNTIMGSLGETLQQLEIMKAGAPDPASQAKYIASATLLRTVKERWTRIGFW